MNGTLKKEAKPERNTSADVTKIKASLNLDETAVFTKFVERCETGHLLEWSSNSD
ncbi:hypothetical protein PMIN05_006786 [Paraphaeosphaeria minitans]